MAHTYSHLFDLQTTGLRFSQFTGLGAGLIWHFFICKSALENKTIDGIIMEILRLYLCRRYCKRGYVIDNPAKKPDLEGILHLITHLLLQIYNIGNNNPAMDFISACKLAQDQKNLMEINSVMFLKLTLMLKT